MSKFALLSADGAGLPLAWRLHNEGHKVSIHIHEPKAKHLYKGLLKHVEDVEEAVEGDPIVVLDSVGIGTEPDDRPETEEEWKRYDPLSEQLKRKGFRVFGSNKLADHMEFDRAFGAKLAKQAGLLVPETHSFDNFDDAIALVEETKKRYILKPHGNQAVFSNYPSEGWEDMVAWLEHLRDADHLEDVSLELQEFITGQQLSTEGYWNGSEFVSLNHTFEHKPMLDKDLGPYTGETGSLIFWKKPNVKDRLAEETILKLTSTMEKHGYPPAPLDVNCIVNEEGCHFLEFTARLGYPALYSQLSTITSNMGDAIEHLVDGTFEGFELAPETWHLCSRVWIPMWPYGTTEKKLKDAPLFTRLKPSMMDWVHLVDAYFDGDHLLAGGTDGELMCVTASGASIEEARGILYQRLNDLYLYPMGWRTDLGLQAIDSLANLQRWGYWLPSER